MGAVAEELQLKGLMGSGAEDKEAKEINPPLIKKKSSKPIRQSKKESLMPEIFSVDEKAETSPEGTVAVTDYTVAADLQYLDDKIKSMMMFSENMVEGGKHGRARICKVCGKEGMMGDIQKPIEANHI